jgi:hypothetical protein
MDNSTLETRKVTAQGRRGYACTFCRRRKFVGRLNHKCVYLRLTERYLCLEMRRTNPMQVLCQEQTVV